MKIKLAPRGGETVDGFLYPEGAGTKQCDAAICRNKQLWGDDSDLFRPDRWLEVDEATRRRYENCIGCIFGTGKWAWSGTV
jgi:hypothetical protein